MKWQTSSIEKKGISTRLPSASMRAKARQLRPPPLPSGPITAVRRSTVTGSRSWCQKVRAISSWARLVTEYMSSGRVGCSSSTGW